MLNQTAPYSQEAEEAVIGAVLINPNAFLTVSSFLKVDDFFFLRHQYVWNALLQLSDRREKIDILTLMDALKGLGKLEEIGGPAFLTQLMNATPTSVHAEVYGRIVERASIRRRLLTAADEIKLLAGNEEMTIETVTGEAEARLFSVTDRQVKRDFISLYEAINDYSDRIENLMANHEESMGVPSGFRDLDELLGGFQKSDLLIFAGRPGMGKCVTGDTLLRTANGVVRIDALRPAAPGRADGEGGVYYPLEIGVQTPTGMGRTSHFYDSGLRPTLRVTTRAGNQLTGTHAHPLLARAADGRAVWTSLAHLHAGDFVAVQPSTELSAMPQWDEILQVEDGGLQPCYDLVVPDGHAFVANGIVNHNTSFLLSLAVNSARVGARVAIFTMEMGVDQITQRIISMETGIGTQQLRLGRLTPQEYSRFVEASGRTSNFPIYIDDTPAMTPQQMRTKCRRMMHEHGLDLIIVDYMQLMNSGGVYANNRVQEISFISRALKELARELNVPMISAAQLSRAVEQRQDKRPVLSDLRESGSIEQDADIVMFLYRDAVYNEACEFPNLAEIIIAKHRNGPTGMISLYFDNTITKFLDGVKRAVDLGNY